MLEEKYFGISLFGMVILPSVLVLPPSHDQHENPTDPARDASERANNADDHDDRVLAVTHLRHDRADDERSDSDIQQLPLITHSATGFRSKVPWIQFTRTSGSFFGRYPIGS